MVEIKKLPPGEAYGARDLQKWAFQRKLGRSGVGPDRTCVCKSCGRYFELKPERVKKICKACRKAERKKYRTRRRPRAIRKPQPQIEVIGPEVQARLNAIADQLKPPWEE